MDWTKKIKGAGKHCVEARNHARGSLWGCGNVLRLVVCGSLSILN
jgi:hypothetical protein